MNAIEAVEAHFREKSQTAYCAHGGTKARDPADERLWKAFGIFKNNDLIHCLAECEQALADSIRTGKVGWMQEIAREHALKILKQYPTPNQPGA